MIVHSPDTGYAKELWRWDHTVNETNPVDPSIRGLRPVGFQEFPKMLFRSDAMSAGPLHITETLTVGNDHEERLALAKGFHVTQEDALEAAKGLQLDVAKAAAERAYQDRLMGEKARLEAARADEAHDGHMGAVPVTPIRKRGRPAKKVEALA